MVGYFNGFASLARAGLSEEALRAFSRFCELLGFVRKPGKSAVGNAAVFLGMLGVFPSPGNNGIIAISLPEEKRAKWPHLLESYLQVGSISHRCVEKLIGRLSFSLTIIFGKFARTHLRPLYRKFYRRFCSAKLPQPPPTPTPTPRTERFRAAASDYR